MPMNVVRVDRQPIDVESLVSWAVREELPKRPFPVRDDPMRYLAELGTRIDRSARASDEPGFLSDMPPHPDALTIGHAIRTLPDKTIDWRRSGAALMGPLACWLERDALIGLLLDFQVSALLTMHGILRSRPPWDVGEIRPVRVLGPNNKPKVEGITAGGRYALGAVCPLQLSVDPRTIANARGEYAAWHDGLCQVKATAERWGLMDYHVTGPAAPPQPWIDPGGAHGGRKPQILREN